MVLFGYCVLTCCLLADRSLCTDCQQGGLLQLCSRWYLWPAARPVAVRLERRRLCGFLNEAVRTHSPIASWAPLYLYLSKLIQPLVFDYILHPRLKFWCRLRTALNHRWPCFCRCQFTCLEQSSSRSAPIPDIFYFQNTPEVTSVQYILPFSLSVSSTFLHRPLEAACAAYASLNLSLLHYITLVASSGASNIPTVRSGLPLSSWNSTVIPCWEPSPDIWHQHSMLSALCWHSHAGGTIHQTFDARQPCLPSGFITCVEQPAVICQEWTVTGSRLRWSALT